MFEPHAGHYLEILAYAVTVVLIFAGTVLFIRLVMRFDKSNNRRSGKNPGTNRAGRRMERRGSRDRRR